MTWLDICVIVIGASGFIMGFISGLIQQIGRVIGLVISTYAAILYNDVAAYLLEGIVGPVLKELLSHILLFLVLYIGFIFLMYLVDRAVRILDLKLYDRIFGGVLGTMEALIIAGILLLGIALYPSDYTKKIIKRSKTATPMLKTTRTLFLLIPGKIKSRLDRFLYEVKQMGKEEIRDRASEKIKND